MFQAKQKFLSFILSIHNEDLIIETVNHVSNEDTSKLLLMRHQITKCRIQFHFDYN